MSAEALRLRALAAALTLLSGAVMVLAGYIGHTESWTLAGFIPIPGGILILAAIALARRADRANGQTVAPNRSHWGNRAGVMSSRRIDAPSLVDPRRNASCVWTDPGSPLVHRTLRVCPAGTRVAL
jgi:hypothetical protein